MNWVFLSPPLLLRCHPLLARCHCRPAGRFGGGEGGAGAPPATGLRRVVTGISAEFSSLSLVYSLSDGWVAAAGRFTQRKDEAPPGAPLSLPQTDRCHPAACGEAGCGRRCHPAACGRAGGGRRTGRRLNPVEKRRCHEKD